MENVVEEVMKSLKESEEIVPCDNERHELIGLAQSGLLQKIGIKTTESQLKQMKDVDVKKLYDKYQNIYISNVSDDLVNNMLYGYASFMNWMFPKTNKEKLVNELKSNFVVGAEIKKQLGTFGIFLSPWLAVANVAVITAKNVDTTEESDLQNGIVELEDPSKLEITPPTTEDPSIRNDIAGLEIAPRQKAGKIKVVRV